MWTENNIDCKWSSTSDSNYNLFPALVFSLKENPGSLFYD